VFSNLVKHVANRGGFIEDAEDVFHDGLFKVYKKFQKPGFQLNGSMFAYIYRTCVNTWQDKQRKKKAPTVSIDSGEKLIDAIIGNLETDETASAEYLLFLKESEKLVQKAIQELSDKCREILLLRYYEDLDYEEIAHRLGVSDGTLRKRNADCKGKVKRALQQNLQDLAIIYPFLQKFLEQFKRSSETSQEQNEITF